MKVYLGNGIYAEWIPKMESLVLTTMKNDEIYIDIAVLGQLLSFLEKIKENKTK